jgi:hypothetical protein
MAVTATVKGQPFRLGRIWRLYLTLVFTGNYATPGDVLSFLTQKLTLSNRTSTAVPLDVQIHGTALDTVYRYIPGATRDVGTVTVEVAGVECSDTAYPAGVLADVVTCIADFAA